MFQTCLKCEIKIIFNIRSSSIPSPVNKAFRKDIYNYKRLIYNPYVNFTNLIAETYSQTDISCFISLLNKTTLTILPTYADDIALIVYDKITAKTMQKHQILKDNAIA